MITNGCSTKITLQAHHTQLQWTIPTNDRNYNVMACDELKPRGSNLEFAQINCLRLIDPLLWLLHQPTPLDDHHPHGTDQ